MQVNKIEMVTCNKVELDAEMQNKKAQLSLGKTRYS